MTEHRPAPAELLAFPSALALPEPYIPANIGLRDFPFMPIEVDVCLVLNFTPEQAILSGEPA